MDEGNQAKAPEVGDVSREVGRQSGEQDRDGNADLELRRLEGTLAGKEWFIPMSWDDQGYDRGRDRNLTQVGPPGRAQRQCGVERRALDSDSGAASPVLGLLPTS